MNPIYWLLSKIHQGLALFAGSFCSLAYQVQELIPMRVRFCLGFLLLAGTSFLVAFQSIPWAAWVAVNITVPETVALALADTVVPEQFATFCLLANIFGFVCCGVAVLSLVPLRLVLYVQRLTWFAFAVLWLWLFTFAYNVPGMIHDYDYKAFSGSDRNQAWQMFLWPWMALTIFPLLLGFVLLLRATRDAYRWDPESQPSWADRLHDNIRTGRGDRRFRSSVYYAASLFLAIIILPFLWMLFYFGLEDPFNLPKGRGEQTVQMKMKIKKIKKKRKKYVVNPWSPFSFEQPKMDKSNIIEELEHATSDQYAAKTGKSGLGRGGKGKGGWPEGVEGSVFRFIRLKYSGGDWDLNMGRSADYNMLIELNKVTGFKIARETEAIEIHRLGRFPKDHAPPFVYMTGKQGWSLSSSDRKALQQYCLKEGGCLFIDIASPRFGHSVKSNMRKIFPGKEFVYISDDDPLFKAPFEFPSGMPVPWSHDGREARGIKHNGRWVVIYSPGNLGDAWRTGHSGVNKAVANQAYHIGINVINYSVNQYYIIHFEQ